MGPASLVVSKDEQFIVLDRRAHGAAETVLNEYGPGYTGAIAEKIVGIEIGVAQIVEEVAVIFVSAGAGDQLHLSAGIASVFSLAALSDHTKLAHRVRVGGCERETQARRDRIVHVDAVQRVVVAARSQTIDVRVTCIGARGRALLENLHSGAGKDGQRERGTGQLRQRADVPQVD